MEGLTFSGLPLTEFDNDRFSMLDPMKMKDIGLPASGVIVFYGRVVESLVNSGRLQPAHTIESILYPVKIYRTTLYKKDLTVVCPPGCGGPVAGALIEELICAGVPQLGRLRIGRLSPKRVEKGIRGYPERRYPG